MKKLLAGICLSSIALTASAAPNYAQQNPEQWSYTIAPYLWFISLNGQAGVGELSTHVDQTFSDLWSSLNFAGMLFFEARYNKVGIFLDAVYSNVSNSTHVDGVPVSMRNHYGIYTPGLSYEAVRNPLSDHSEFIMVPYVGGRITVNNTTVKVDGVNGTDNINWTDAVIGSRFIFKIYKNWTLSLTADMGGTTDQNQRSYNGVLMAGYAFSGLVFPISLFGGYRYLHQTYITGSGPTYYEWDMGVYGPLIGVDMKF